MKTRSGKDVHPIGIGTWGIASRPIQNGVYAAEPVHGHEDQEVEAMKYSLAQGQNHFDCAEMYGGFYTDEVVGRALKGQPREDIFVADKLWKTSMAKGRVRGTVDRMLNKLGIQYLDMLYIHWPFPDGPWQEAIPQIDELIDAGLVRHFGVSNFTVTQMLVAMQLSKHPITANQMHYNVLYKTEVDDDFRAFCKQHDITLVAYSPMARAEVTQNIPIGEIALAHQNPATRQHATAPQVALAWLLSKGALTIPKATRQDHIDENLGAMQLELTPEEIATLDQL